MREGLVAMSEGGGRSGIQGRMFMLLQVSHKSESQLIRKCAVPENIHTPPTEGFFVLQPPSPPGNSSLASNFTSKILTFKTPSP